MPLQPIRLAIDPVVTSPFPLDMTLIKQHVAVDFSDQDALLESYALAAIDAFENSTHRTLFLRGHYWTLRDFPRTGYQEIHLPRGKTQIVHHIAYTFNGVVTELYGPGNTEHGSPPAPGTDWLEDITGDDGAVLMPPQGESWPTVDLDVPSPVLIHFLAGYMDGQLPSDILNALLFHIRTSLDDQRTDPQKTQANLATFETLVSGYRLSRVY